MSAAPPVPTRWHRVRGDLLALLLVLLVALLPRLLVLDADPPSKVLGAFLSDEGWWAQNARQRVLFGQWIMDDHNPALFAAPAYTAVVTAVYHYVGLGLAETRLASALAGTAASLLLFAGLRAVLPIRRALAPALLLALGAFPILMSRLAFTESVQLAFAVLGLAGVLWATRSPGFGMLGGLGFMLAVLSKPNAVILGPVFALWWLLEFRRLRRAGEQARPLWLQVGAFALAVVLVTTTVGVLLVLPHWSAIREQLAVSLASVYAPNRRLADGGSYLFFLPFLSLRPSLFFVASTIPMIGLGILLWRSLVHSDTEAPGPAERLAWAWWWVVLGYLATQSYQPDRRFLLLAPALAILAATGFREMPTTGRAGGGRGRRLLACTLIGGLTGLFVMSYGVHPLEALLSNVRLGEDAGVSFYSIQLLLWHATVGAAALLAWWNPAPAWRLRVPAWGWATAFLLTEAVPLALHYARPHFSERDAARAIAEVSRALEPQRRVMTGFLAHSLALESDIFPFYIRDDSVTGARMNLDGWERFRPTMAVTSMRGETVVGPAIDPAAHGLAPLCRIPLWHQVADPDSVEVTLWFTTAVQPPPACPPPAVPAR
ncbi:MAG: hypothetical protein JNM53_15430 [Gemmatimonadetes bacterium]|nr:hypothetical protein [Gemmatimonadota bacterium]